MLLFRIGSCKYIDDLSGTGAALYGGRWNNKGTYLVYAASSYSLALLEALVHTGQITSMNFCSISIQIPDTRIKEIYSKDLPVNWQEYPAPDQLKIIGDDFVKESKYMALKLPSVIVPDEYNFLLNPFHKDFKAITIKSQKKITVDNRLLFRNT